MGRKDEMFGRLFRRMDDGKLSLFFWMGVSCCQLVVFRRFGQWTATNPFTPQRSMTSIYVIIWLGVQTGNKRTTREWTRPGNRPTISFWLGEFINGLDLWEMGLNYPHFSSTFWGIVGSEGVETRSNKRATRAHKHFFEFFPIFLFLSDWVAECAMISCQWVNKTHAFMLESFNEFDGSRRFVNFPNFNSPVFA